MQIFLFVTAPRIGICKLAAKVRRDRDLNEVGVRQAEHIAMPLRSETIHGIYSSDLKRARQTANSISRASQPARAYRGTAFANSIMAHLEGLTFNEIKENYREFLQRWRTEPAEIASPRRRAARSMSPRGPGTG